MTNSNNQIDQCDEALEDFASTLKKGNITESDIVVLKMKFPKCSGVIEKQYEIWQDLANIDVPEVSDQLHSKFYSTLAEFNISEGNKKAKITTTSKDNIRPLWSNPWRWAIAGSILLAGILLGRTFNNEHLVNQYDLEIAEKSNAILSYTSQSNQYSATQKLIAIQEIKEEVQPGDKIIDVLYQVLLNDPSINVRLTSIETLIHFADEPRAREYLLRAIPYQESALVQVALADAMLLLQEKQSADAWTEILNSPNVEPDVKIHITETLETLL